MRKCRYHVHEQMQLVPFERKHRDLIGDVRSTSVKIYRCPIAGCPNVECAESESGEVLSWYERRYKTGMARYEEVE